MFSKIGNILLNIHYWLKARPKFIHLCWWFEKHNLPIPPYFVGGTANLVQTHWGHSDDDNADPDDNTYTIDSTRTSQSKNENFILRFQVVENGGKDVKGAEARLYCSTDNTFVTGVFQVTTSAATNASNIAAGTITEANNVSAQKLGAQTETWQDGYSVDVSDQSGTFQHDGNGYTEHCFSVEMNGNAANNTTYYFRCYYDATLNTYTNTGAVTTEEAQRRIFITHI